MLDEYITFVFITAIIYIFRHTGDLESFNSMMLKYAPKRMSYEYQYYKDRMFLAGLDHNIHLFRDYAKSKKGELLYARKYSKRSKKWHAQPVKVAKSYPHFRKMLASIIKRRIDHTEKLKKFNSPKNDPKLISPTIGGQPPETSDLIKKHISRM